MKKILLYILLASTLLAASGFAETVKVTDKGAPIASVDIPGGWKPDATEKDFQTFGKPDGSVFVKVKAISNDRKFKAIVDDTEKMLRDTVSSDLTRKNQSTFKVAGVEANEIHYKGDMDGGAGSFVVVLVPLKDKTILMLSWGLKKDEKAQSAAIRKIATSIKTL